MKLDLSAILIRAFSSLVVMEYFLFLFFWLVVIILIKALSNRALKKFNPKPLKTSTLAIILVVAIALTIISWLSLSK